MSKELTQQYAERIGDRIEQINPYRQDSKEYWLYEVGVLRSILAQCALRDSHVMDMFYKQCNRIKAIHGQ
jgi:hypothetical protein